MFSLVEESSSCTHLLIESTRQHYSIYEPIDPSLDEIVYSFQLTRKASHAKANKRCHIKRLAFPTFLEDGHVFLYVPIEVI